MVYVFILLGWVLCGFLTYGIANGYFSGEFPTLAKEKPTPWEGLARGYALIGPIGLICSLCLSGGAKYGLRYKVPKE